MSLEAAPKPAAPILGPNFSMFLGIGIILALASAIEGFSEVAGGSGATSGGGSHSSGGGHGGH